MLPQLLLSPSFNPGLPLKAFLPAAEGPICRFLKDLRLLVFFLLRALREAAQRAIRKGSNNLDTRSKRHGDSSWHPRFIPTILREPSSRRSDRRARISFPRSELAKNMYSPAPSRCISGCSGLIGGVRGACLYREATNYTPDRLTTDTCSLRSVPRNVR